MRRAERRRLGRGVRRVRRVAGVFRCGGARDIPLDLLKSVRKWRDLAVCVFAGHGRRIADRGQFRAHRRIVRRRRFGMAAGAAFRTGRRVRWPDPGTWLPSSVSCAAALAVLRDIGADDSREPSSIVLGRNQRRLEKQSVNHAAGNRNCADFQRGRAGCRPARASGSGQAGANSPRKRRRPPVRVPPSTCRSATFAST